MEEREWIGVHDLLLSVFVFSYPAPLESTCHSPPVHQMPSDFRLWICNHWIPLRCAACLASHLHLIPSPASPYKPVHFTLVPCLSVFLSWVLFWSLLFPGGFCLIWTFWLNHCLPLLSALGASSTWSCRNLWNGHNLWAWHSVVVAAAFNLLKWQTTATLFWSEYTRKSADNNVSKRWEWLLHREEQAQAIRSALEAFDFSKLQESAKWRWEVWTLLSGI